MKHCVPVVVKCNDPAHDRIRKRRQGDDVQHTPGPAFGQENDHVHGRVTVELHFVDRVRLFCFFPLRMGSDVARRRTSNSRLRR